MIKNIKRLLIFLAIILAPFMLLGAIFAFIWLMGFIIVLLPKKIIIGICLVSLLILFVIMLSDVFKAIWESAVSIVDRYWS